MHLPADSVRAAAALARLHRPRDRRTSLAGEVAASLHHAAAVLGCGSRWQGGAGVPAALQPDADVWWGPSPWSPPCVVREPMSRSRLLGLGWRGGSRRLGTRRRA